MTTVETNFYEKCNAYVNDLLFEDKTGVDALEGLPCENLIRRLNPDGFIMKKDNKKTAYDPIKAEVMLNEIIRRLNKDVPGSCAKTFIPFTQLEKSAVFAALGKLANSEKEAAERSLEVLISLSQHSDVCLKELAEKTLKSLHPGLQEKIAEYPSYYNPDRVRIKLDDSSIKNIDSKEECNIENLNNLNINENNKSSEDLEEKNNINNVDKGENLNNIHVLPKFDRVPDPTNEINGGAYIALANEEQKTNGVYKLRVPKDPCEKIQRDVIIKNNSIYSKSNYMKIKFKINIISFWDEKIPVEFSEYGGECMEQSIFDMNSSGRNNKKLFGNTRNALAIVQDKININDSNYVYRWLFQTSEVTYLISSGGQLGSGRYLEPMKVSGDHCKPNYVILFNKNDEKNNIDKFLEKDHGDEAERKVRDKFIEFMEYKVSLQPDDGPQETELDPEIFYQQFDWWLGWNS